MSLQGMRDASEKPLAKVLMGLLIFSFVGWGAASWILGDTAPTSAIATIGNIEITQQKFEEERRRQLAQISHAMQQQLFVDRVSQVHFNQQVLTNMTTRILLEQHAANIGLITSPSAIADIIKNSPEFWVEDQFSTDKFDAFLAVNRLSENTFTDGLRRQALREMLLVSLASNAPIPEFMLTAIYNTRYAARKIEFSTVRFNAFPIRTAPTDAELSEIHAQNPKMIPEYRVFSYVLVDARMNAPDSYERGFDAIRSIEDMLIAGDSMQDAARKMRGTVRTLIPMTIHRLAKTGNQIIDPILTDEIAQSLFLLEKGAESEIIETKKGFVIFRVEGIELAHAAPIESRRQELVNLWRTGEQRKLAYKRANEIIVDKETLSNNVTITRTVGAPLEVLSAAFAMDIGRPQIVPGVNAFHVVKVNETIMPNIDAKLRGELKKEIENILSRQIMDDYMNFLARKYKIKQNDRVMRRLMGAE